MICEHKLKNTFKYVKYSSVAARFTARVMLTAVRLTSISNSILSIYFGSWSSRKRIRKDFYLYILLMLDQIFNLVSFYWTGKFFLCYRAMNLNSTTFRDSTLTCCRCKKLMSTTAVFIKYDHKYTRYYTGRLVSKNCVFCVDD